MYQIYFLCKQNTTLIFLIRSKKLFSTITDRDTNCHSTLGTSILFVAFIQPHLPHDVSGGLAGLQTIIHIQSEESALKGKKTFAFCTN